MKEDNNILDIIHLCPKCKDELEFLTTDEIQIEQAILSIIVYMCPKCEIRLDVIDIDKVYLNEIQSYLIKNNIVKTNINS